MLLTHFLVVSVTLVVATVVIVVLNYIFHFSLETHNFHHISLASLFMSTHIHRQTQTPTFSTKTVLRSNALKGANNGQIVLEN